jgi:aspartyl-tRNA(Asn)/glutamyl-tRNA(Gln) amidotransferase subunit A
MSRDITELTLCELSAAISRREISSLEATKASLAAIENAQPRLNCFISIERQDALAAATRADSEMAAGRRRGPLHGVPMAHKDMFYRSGKVVTCGAKIRRDFVADTTATVHERLDAAGAVCLGGLNMSEFAVGPTGHNDHFGHCRNPWNAEHITGGSSSGSGAAVAARLAYGSLGSDTGGSIRLPAAMCGVTGLKPTYGLISRYGIMPRCWSLDVVGPLARTARDCAVITACVAGHDPRDSTSAVHAVPDYEAQLGGDLRGFRIGIPTNPIFAATDPEVQAALTQAITVLASLGAEVVEVDLPDPALIYTLTNVVNKSEAATIHARWLRERPHDYSLSVRTRIEAGFHIPATQYLDAIRTQGRLLSDFVAKVFQQVDVVHMPVLGIPVPTISETEVHYSAGIPELIERITRYTRWVSYLGLPALSVPGGFSSNGLPVGFQLLGRPFSEATLFRVAHVYQQETGWHLRAPPAVHSQHLPSSSEAAS